MKSGSLIAPVDPSTDQDATATIARLGAAVGTLDPVLIYSHMNPDPDTIGSAVGLRLLLSEHFGKRVTMCYRGIVGRAENQQMLRLLAPDLIPARLLDQAPFAGAFLVDAQPDYGILLDQDLVPLVGVVDHHPVGKPSVGVPFVDVRPDYGATSTIVTEYLRSAGVEPDPRVATALLYGIKTDTQDLARRASPADVEAYNWLLARIDRGLLGQIENPPLNRDYFNSMVAAIGRAITYNGTVVTELGAVPYPDMVAEIADLLIQMEGMIWSVVFGMHDHRIYLSVRSRPCGRDAGEVVRQVLGKDGVGGGHDTMAAGRIQLLEESEETYLRIVSEVWSRFLDVLGEEAAVGRRLVPDALSPPRVTPAG